MQFSKVFKKSSNKIVISVVILFSLMSLQFGGFYAQAGNASSCTPDFSLVGSKPQTIAAGWHGEVAFTATSECGLFGTVLYSISISPNIAYPNGIALHQPTYHPTVLSSTHPSGTVAYQVLTTPTTVKTNYTITFTVSVNNVSHTVTMLVKVNGYTITASPTSLSAKLGQQVQSTITLTSFGGYNATIYYSIAITPNPPAIGTNDCFNPVPGGPTINSNQPTATSTWTCTITPEDTYTVTITAMPLSGAPDLSTSITVKVTK